MTWKLDIFPHFFKENKFIDFHWSVVKVGYISPFENLKISIDVSQSQKIFKRCQGDINFHLKICINIQFHRYWHLKYQFVCKYMKKITMENLDGFWTEFGENLDEKVDCI